MRSIMDLLPKRGSRALRRAAGIAAASLVVSGCSGGGSPSGPQPGPPITSPKVAAVDVSPASSTMRTGGSVLLTATPRTASGTPVVGLTITWESDDANLTIMPVAGAPDEVEITSAVATTARVAATAQTPEGPVSGEGTVTFRVITVSAMTVLPSTTTLPIGRTMRFTAFPRNDRGFPEPLALVAWSSSDPNVSVTPYAFHPHQADVRSFVEAEAVITATAGDVSASGTIRFFSDCPPVDHVQVAITNGVIDVGQTTQLQAIPKDGAGNTLPITGCAIEWTSTPGVTLAVDPSNPALATGTGASPGEATVTATVGGVPGSVRVIVRAP